MPATRYADYRRAVESTLAAYRRRHFAGREALFERVPGGRVRFRAEAAHRNFFDAALYHALTARPLAFRSPGNPQVLAISVFGTLARREELPLLAGEPCDDGAPLLSPAEAQEAGLEIQRRFPLPGGRRPAIVDLWLTTGTAIIGRLMERGLGPVARVAALLAAVAEPGAGRRQVLVVYDGRNPAFASGRIADREFLALQARLPEGIALRRMSWQALARAMARSEWLSDLLAYIRSKYGIEAAS